MLTRLFLVIVHPTNTVIEDQIKTVLEEFLLQLLDYIICYIYMKTSTSGEILYIVRLGLKNPVAGISDLKIRQRYFC